MPDSTFVSNDTMMFAEGDFPCPEGGYRPENSESEFKIHLIAPGADPHPIYIDGMWYLLRQGDPNDDANGHNGFDGLEWLISPTIEGLTQARVVKINLVDNDPRLKRVWAPVPVLDSDGKLRIYVTACLGPNNEDHRHHCLEADLTDPLSKWRYRGPLIVPEEDDVFAIDLAKGTIPYKGQMVDAAFVSKWRGKYDCFPQHIGLARFKTPTELERSIEILTPAGNPRCYCPDEIVLGVRTEVIEGPEIMKMEGKFRGIWVTTGFSGSKSSYKQEAAVPLDPEEPFTSPWILSGKTFLLEGFGAGHGQVVQDGEKYYYVGHLKTTDLLTWKDRWLFYVELPRNYIESYIAGIAPETAAYHFATV